MKLAYIVGPYTAPNYDGVEWNIKRARVAALRLWRMGYVAVCPHTMTAHFDQDAPEVGYDYWVNGLMEVLEKCDLVAKIDGWERSKGSLAEIARAKELGIPVYLLSEVPDDPDEVPKHPMVEKPPCWHPCDLDGIGCDEGMEHPEADERVRIFDKDPGLTGPGPFTHDPIPLTPATELKEWTPPPTLGDDCTIPDDVETDECEFKGERGECTNPKGTCPKKEG